MANEEIGGYILVGIYGLTLLAAIRVFGIRRVALVFIGLVVLGLAIGLRAVGAIASSRRY